MLPMNQALALVLRFVEEEVEVVAQLLLLAAQQAFLLQLEQHMLRNHQNT